MNPYVSIVIPAYNEAARLPETLVLIKDFIDQQDYTAEIVVIDDGSSDDTVTIVKKMARRIPELRLIENAQNKGKGKVVQQGMLEAAGAFRLFMDADYSTPITELPKLLAEADTASVVIGSRYLRPDSIKVKQPLKRRIISRTCNWLIQRLVLPGIKDTQCGFKLFSAEATRASFPDLTRQGWSFDIELLVIASQRGFAIKEVPVDWFDAKQSTLRASRGAVPFIKDLWTIYKKMKSGGYLSSIR